MKQLLFIIILISLYSCKGQEKNEKTILITEENTYKLPEPNGAPYVLHFISPYTDVPIASKDSIKLCIRKLVCKYDKNLIVESIGESNNFGTQFDRRVYTKLFPKENIIKAVFYSTKSEKRNNSLVFDLYYLSKKEARQTFNDIKKIIEVNKFDKGLIEYFRPCGRYLLLNNNRITTLESADCWKYYIVDKFIQNNKNEFDEIIHITEDYNEHKELIRYEIINKTK